MNDNLELPGQLSNGIKLGGIFADFHKKIGLLTAHNLELEEGCKMLEEECNGLHSERKSIRSQWKTAALDLSLQLDENSQLEAIFEELRRDKSQLQMHCETLSAELIHASDKNSSLENVIQSMDIVNAELRCRVSQLESMITIEAEENKSLRDIMYARDEELAQMKSKVHEMESERQILIKSLQTKDRQLVSIVKDRDRSKSSLEALKCSILPCQRNADVKGLTSKFQSSSTEKPKKPLLPSNTHTGRPVLKAKVAINRESIDDLENFNSFLIRSEPFDSKERQYAALSRQRKSETIKLKSDSR